MNVALLSYTVDETGGWGRIAVNTARALQKQGNTCTVFTSRHETCPADIDCRPILFTSMDMHKNRIYSRLDQLRLLSTIRDYDIVHAITEQHMHLASLLGKPYVFTTHGSYASAPLADPKLKTLYQKIYLDAHRVIITSHYTREKIEENLTFDNWTYLPNGVDSEKFTILPDITREPKTFITTGAIKPRKGQDLGVAALKLLVNKHPDAKYIVVGENQSPIFYQELQDTIKAAGLENNVVFTGRISDEELIKYENQSIAYLQPSRVNKEGAYEGAPVALLEAASCGLPIIGTTVTASVSLIEDGVNGFLIPDDDPRAIAEALDKLFNDSERARTMSQAARAFAEGLSWDANASHLLEIYKQALG